MIPSGLYVSDKNTTLKSDFCKSVLGLIDLEPWRVDLKRRTQHYGARYDYTTKKLLYDVEPLDKCYGIVGLINCLTPLFHTLCDVEGIKRSDIQQCIVNEYTSGQHISPHIDSPIFGPIVLTVTIGDTQEFKMTNKITSQSYSISPWNGCVVALTGDARNLWTHQTIGVKESGFRRISVTFRSIV